MSAEESLHDKQEVFAWAYGSASSGGGTVATGASVSKNGCLQGGYPTAPGGRTPDRSFGTTGDSSQSLFRASENEISIDDGGNGSKLHPGHGHELSG